MESSRMRDGEDPAGKMRTHVTYLDMVTEDYLHTIGNIFLTRSVSIASAKCIDFNNNLIRRRNTRCSFYVYRDV